MHHKNRLIPVLLVSVAGWLGNAQAAELPDPANSAKVRVYQEADISLYPGEYCYGSNSKTAIHNSASLWRTLGIHKREGIPATDDVTGSYDEYVIQAGVPVSVSLHWEAEKGGIKASCGPIGSTFYPQAGKNYDVTMGYAGNCFVQIRELLEISPGKASARQAPSSYSYACGNN